MFQTRALTRRLPCLWMSALTACICHMTGWPVFLLRTETVMRSRLRKIWTTKSKLCCAKRQPKCPLRSDIRKKSRRNSGGPDECRCSDDKSSRWNFGHYAGQRQEVEARSVNHE